MTAWFELDDMFDVIRRFLDFLQKTSVSVVVLWRNADDSECQSYGDYRKGSIGVTRHDFAALKIIIVPIKWEDIQLYRKKRQKLCHCRQVRTGPSWRKNWRQLMLDLV